MDLRGHSIATTIADKRAAGKLPACRGLKADPSPTIAIEQRDLKIQGNSVRDAVGRESRFVPKVGFGASFPFSAGNNNDNQRPFKRHRI